MKDEKYINEEIKQKERFKILKGLNPSEIKQVLEPEEEFYMDSYGQHDGDVVVGQVVIWRNCRAVLSSTEEYLGDTNVPLKKVTVQYIVGLETGEHVETFRHLITPVNEMVDFEKFIEEVN